MGFFARAGRVGLRNLDMVLGGEGIHKFAKSQEGNHGDITGIWHFYKLTHGAENREFSNKKASFEAFEKSCRHFGKTDRVWKRVFRHLVKYPDAFRIVHCVLPILICGTMEEMKVRKSGWIPCLKRPSFVFNASSEDFIAFPLAYCITALHSFCFVMILQSWNLIIQNGQLQKRERSDKEYGCFLRLFFGTSDEHKTYHVVVF